MAAYTAIVADGKLLASRIPKSYFAEAIKFIEQHFFPNENINKALDLFTKGTTTPGVRHFLRNELEQDMSFMTIDRQSQRIVGILLSAATTPELKKEKGKVIQELVAEEPKWRAFIALQQKLFPYDIFQEFGSDRIVEYNHATFLRQYQGKGLVKQMASMTQQLSYERGYDTELCVATHDATVSILKHQRFRVHRTVALSDIIFEGKPIIYKENPEAKFRILISKKGEGN